jgi:hypothetical protein
MVTVSIDLGAYATPLTHSYVTEQSNKVQSRKIYNNMQHFKNGCGDMGNKFYGRNWIWLLIQGSYSPAELRCKEMAYRPRYR